MVVLGLVEDCEKFQWAHAISTLFKSLARGNFTGAFSNIRPAAGERPQTESTFPDKEKLVGSPHYGACSEHQSLPHTVLPVGQPMRPP